jgi:hypothetical protein
MFLAEANANYKVRMFQTVYYSSYILLVSVNTLVSAFYGLFAKQ